MNKFAKYLCVLNIFSSLIATHAFSGENEDRFSRVNINTEYAKLNSGPKKVACVFYEENDKRDDFLGPIHARMLESLLGAFPRYVVKVTSILDYQFGVLDQCDVAFYISSNYNYKFTKTFLIDATNFLLSKPLVWMNYKIDQLSEYFNKEATKLGFDKIAIKSTRVIQPSTVPSAVNTDPGFYRYFKYKGQVFEKLARWDQIGNWYSNSPELNELLIDEKDKNKVEILSTATHSRIPNDAVGYEVNYAVRQNFGTGGSLWYFADLPMAFVHYEDRYMIFCDLLWDILGVTPPSETRNALVRIEDVNPSQNLPALRWTIDYLADHNIPFSLALIPLYANQFINMEFQKKPEWKAFTEYPEFMGVLRYAKARGATFVMHGVAHEAREVISGFYGATGADYEFWLYPENKPVVRDSSGYVLDLLEEGESILDKAGILPIAWETPHYAASSLDYILFGKLFEWTYQRPIYFKSDDNLNTESSSKYRLFNCRTPECREERREAFQKVKTNTTYGPFGGQVVPWPVYKDTYGQAVIPETLGMVDYAFYRTDTPNPVSKPDDIIRRAQKLKVVRGAWASFFWHPDLINPNTRYYRENPEHYLKEGGKNTLINIVTAIQKLGYRFRSIADCKFFPGERCTNK